MNRHVFWLGMTAAGLTVGLVALPVRSDPHADRASADALADTAAELIHRGELRQACANYHKSALLEPTTRRFLKLAECQERVGMTTSAWLTYAEARDRAEDRGEKDLASVARQKAARLETNLSRIEIVAPEAADIAGLEVRRDGALVSTAALGVAVPVDPGTHVITATAPGRRPWSTQIGLTPGKTTVTVTVPNLEDDAERLPGEMRRALPPSPDGDPGGTQRTLGWVVGGAGLASVTTAAIFALQANANRSELEQRCVSGVCSSYARDTIDTMHTQATISNVFFVAGMASLVGGAVLYFTAPSSPRSEKATASLRVAPSVAPGAAGVMAMGRF